MIVTMDDATNEHYSMFFVEQEGTQSSLRGVADVIEQHGLFSSFYSDRGSHCWSTPVVGGKVDKDNLTQFGRAMKQLGINMLPAYSPEARGRSERMFRTHQERLPRELALAGITDMEAANGYLACYRPTSMPNSCNRPWNKALHSYPGLVAIWTTFCASNSNAPGKQKKNQQPARQSAARLASGVETSIPGDEKRTIHLLQNRTILFVARVC